MSGVWLWLLIGRIAIVIVTVIIIIMIVIVVAVIIIVVDIVRNRLWIDTSKDARTSSYHFILMTVGRGGSLGFHHRIARFIDQNRIIAFVIANTSVDLIADICRNVCG